jgi:hypothetical protein
MTMMLSSRARRVLLSTGLKGEELWLATWEGLTGVGGRSSIAATSLPVGWQSWKTGRVVKPGTDSTTGLVQRFG